MRGCNLECKRREIGDMMCERKLDVLALSETKLKGKGEISFGEVKGRKSGVRERTRAKEGVAVLLSQEMWESVIECKEVNSRLMWVRLKVGGERWVIISAYGPGSERCEEERNGFWEELSECIGSFEERERVVVLGDLNARVGEEPVEGVIGEFGVPGVNENGEKLVDLCIERELVIGNTWFKKRDIHKYTWESGVDGQRALMDYVLVDRQMKERLVDVNVLRGAARGMSDHFLVEGKVKLIRKDIWRRKGKRERGKKVIKVSELRKTECAEKYQEMMRVEWMRVKDCEWRGVNEECEMFEKAVLRCAKEVCGERKIGGGRRKRGSEWWNEEVKQLIREKKELYGQFLQRRGEEEWERFRRKRQEVKRKVREAKRRAADEWGEQISRNFKENKKLFWKEVNRVRSTREGMSEVVKGANGEVITEETEVKKRWGEYFEGLLNVKDDRLAVVGCLGRGGVGSGRVQAEREIVREEVERALQKTKSGKAAGTDGIAAEFLKQGGVSVRDWLVRLYNICMERGEAPENWQKAVIVPLYKGKGDKRECTNHRGVSLLSITGKVYGRVVINRVIKDTESQIGEEQCGFRKGRGCVDQIFAVKNLCEKYLEKEKELYIAFMDLEKAYDRVDREALWKVLQIYGVGGKLLGAVKSFYAESKACVRVRKEEGEWFGVTTGLRQGCVMSPWLFNVYMDGVVREVNARVLGRGAELSTVGGVQRWEINQLLFADDTALVADSGKKLQRLVTEFGVVCSRRKLRVNVKKSKVMRCAKGVPRDLDEVSLNGEVLEEVENFRYLGVDIAADGSQEGEVKHRVGEGAKILGALRSVWKETSVSRQAKMGMYESIVVPTVMYGCEAWALNAKERKKLEVLEMKCLRTIAGVRWFDRIRNERVREMCGGKRSLLERAEQGVLKWFGHVERMGEERLTKRIYKSEVVGTRGRGRPRRRWRDGVKEALSMKGLNIQEGERRARDRRMWSDVVYGGVT